MRKVLAAGWVMSALFVTSHLRAADGNLADSVKVIPLTRFLEDHPLDKRAPPIRSALVKWEADSKDVGDVVCPGLFKPLPDKAFKYNGELLAQFIFGSAAHQLAVPDDKGKLMPAQLAGMTSMLKAYRTLLAADKDARIPRFDSLSRDEADGSLATTLEPLVIANCLPKQTAKSRFPWTFGMSKAQVSALKGYGPYRSFSNGDLETYNAVFDGHLENFQFFFSDNQLRRIGIFTFEGKDLTAATRAWGDLYTSMQRNFGSIESLANNAPFKQDADSMKVFEANARTLVGKIGHVQMAPIHTPADTRPFARFTEHDVKGTMFYYVTLYFDPPYELAKAGSARGDK
jgi:hypothetical protein